MSPSTTRYVRLRNLSGSDTTLAQAAGEAVGQQSMRSRRKILNPCRVTTVTLVFLASIVLNLVFAGRALVSNSASLTRFMTYSPAASVVRQERVVFSSGFGIEQSPFQGTPSEENNKLWADLYDFGISRISTEEARPLGNKTLPIPGEEGGYVIQLSVFHQLHCLNLIRKGVYGAVDMTNKDELLGIEHLDHCLDMLRQAVMCSSDITPITFARTSPHSSMKVVAEVVHTCRNFANIQQWAWNRRLVAQLDKDTVVTDDPLGWGSYTYSP